MDKTKKKEKEEKGVSVPRKATDIQRFKLEKLMKNPAKPAYVPERPEEKLPRVFNPPEFIRNIWGSSAGAGSGDFHVYRGVRRREYARQKFENFMADKNDKDVEFQVKLLEHKKEAEERTAKKRAKRQKKKAKQKAAKKSKGSQSKQKESSSEEDSDEEEEETTSQQEAPACVKESETKDSEENDNDKAEPSTTQNSAKEQQDSDKDSPSDESGS